MKASLLVLLSIAMTSVACSGQTTPRVTPAILPLPSPWSVPKAPDYLRAHNPWILSMTGNWRFQLTHGKIVADRFVPGVSSSESGITASSYEDQHPPLDAFDSSQDTRWCASSDSFPQWLQADLGKVSQVTGANIAWERREGYRCRIEGSLDGKHWAELADKSAATGIGNGPVDLKPASVRFVRITVLGSTAGGWASIREFQIQVEEGGTRSNWIPKASQEPQGPTDQFAQTAFNDHAWDNLAVPSNWEVAGYSLPTYNAVDNTVGLYRRWVTVPKSWVGRRIYWRFDGALDGAEIFVNGKKAGYHESGYTAFDVDLTGLVRPGESNLFAVRLSKSTPSDDCETGDYQCLGGIYRDTSLIAVPEKHVSDLTVRTVLKDHYRDADLQADVEVACSPGDTVQINGFVTDEKGRKLPGVFDRPEKATGSSVTIPLLASFEAPKLWSAEKPNLYYLCLQVSIGGVVVERIQQRFGFRQVEVKDNVVLWNGVPIKCTGICRHDFWADKGFALTDKEWIKDLTMMKAANINAIRTSHYNHASRFLELCDEMGMYILDEVPFCWINEKNNDPAFAPALLLRSADTLGRDKNRPCVLGWSLGNENGVGRNSQTVIDFVEAHDPTRPAFICQGGFNRPKGQSFEDMHYPSPQNVDRYLAREKHLPAQFTEQPHTFYEKEAIEYDPGDCDLWTEALQKTWEKIWPSPTIMGSFIWEWQCQGIADKNQDKKTDFWFGLDHLRQENNKGIVSAYRVPKAEYWIVKEVYSPIQISTRTVNVSGGSCVVPVVNQYSFTDLNELKCRWTALAGEKVLDSRTVRVECPALGKIQATFPAPDGMTALKLEFIGTNGVPVQDVRLAVQGAPTPQPPAALASGDKVVEIPERSLHFDVGNRLFTTSFGSLGHEIVRWVVGGRDFLAGSPIMNLGQGHGGSERGFLSTKVQPYCLWGGSSSDDSQTDHARVLSSAKVLDRVSNKQLGTLNMIYDVRANAEIDVQWTLDWTAETTHLWEIGLQIPVPPSFTHVKWYRDSYFTEYPKDHIGEPLGSAKVGSDLALASKRDLYWMTLSDDAGNTLELIESGGPLIGRVKAGKNENLLFASSEIAGSRGLSWSWITDHDTVAQRGKPLSGRFILRATQSKH